ncbi:hypothetical protein Tco_0278389, partial [Tanacetum coccineum]
GLDLESKSPEDLMWVKIQLGMFDLNRRRDILVKVVTEELKAKL